VAVDRQCDQVQHKTQCGEHHSGPERIGHALHQREHDADRWIAAAALRLAISLVSNHGIFNDVPGLLFETAPNG
jgi:hypothetical protein